MPPKVAQQPGSVKSNFTPVKLRLPPQECSIEHQFAPPSSKNLLAGNRTPQQQPSCSRARAQSSYQSQPANQPHSPKQLKKILLFDNPGSHQNLPPKYTPLLQSGASLSKQIAADGSHAAYTQVSMQSVSPHNKLAPGSCTN